MFEDIPDALVDRFQMTKEEADHAIVAEGGNSGMADLLLQISNLRSDIAFKESDMRKSEDEYKTSESNKNATIGKINTLEASINLLRSKIDAEQGKDGLRRGNVYQAEIQQKQSQIAQQRKIANDFLAIQTAYMNQRQEREEVVKSMQSQLKAVEEKYKALSAEMQKKNTDTNP